MDIQIGQRVRISNNAFPDSDDPYDIAMRGQEATVYASVSDNGCWLVETDDYSLFPVLDAELEPIEATQWT